VQYIEITKSELPEKFDFDLGAETFTLGFNYNDTGGFFTIDLLKPNEIESEATPIVLGEKLVLGKPLWSDFSSFELPAPQLIPLDISGTEDRITWENMNEKVFLYINDEGDLDE
jgi:hypothetical protein